MPLVPRRQRCAVHSRRSMDIRRIERKVPSASRCRSRTTPSSANPVLRYVRWARSLSTNTRSSTRWAASSPKQMCRTDRRRIDPTPRQSAHQALFKEEKPHFAEGRKVARCTTPGLEDAIQRADLMGTSWREQDAPNFAPLNVDSINYQLKVVHLFVIF